MFNLHPPHKRHLLYFRSLVKWRPNVGDVRSHVVHGRILQGDYIITCRFGTAWMSRWKLGSMVSKWVISPTYRWCILGLNHPLILTFDPILGHPSTPTGKFKQFLNPTLPETNIAPTNGWLEYYFPIGEAYFQGLR